MNISPHSSFTYIHRSPIVYSKPILFRELSSNNVEIVLDHKCFDVTCRPGAVVLSRRNPLAVACILLPGDLRSERLSLRPFDVPLNHA